MAIDNAHLKRTEEKAREEATQAKTRADKLQGELEQANKDMGGLREELVTSKNEADKLREAMNLKTDKVNFQRGHVSQLTQSISQLALPPSQEEAKKKGMVAVLALRITCLKKSWSPCGSP